MKLFIFLALVAAVLGFPYDTYDDRYDNMDVNEIINNEKLFHSYVNCFLNKGNCTPEGKQINGWISEGVKTSCGKCTEKQKTLVATSIVATREKLPKEYEELIAMHDPENKYRTQLEPFLAKYKS